MAEPKYKEIAAQARKRRDEALPTKYKLSQSSLRNLPRNVTSIPQQHLSAAEFEIVDSKAEHILFKIREKRWSALEVTEAFCKAAAIAHQLVKLPLPVLLHCGNLARDSRTDALSVWSPIFLNCLRESK
ncbi:MAG: hypothetical protein Q9191_008166, partial [Dirinaria sp. TL-2023a]